MDMRDAARVEDWRSHVMRVERSRFTQIYGARRYLQALSL